MQELLDEDRAASLYVPTVANLKDGPTLIEHVSLNGEELAVKRNTGAQLNAISRSELKQWATRPIVYRTRAQVPTHREEHLADG